MDLSRRPHPLTIVVVAAAHVGLLALVLIKPKLPAAGNVTYIDLLRVAPPRPKAQPQPPAVAARPAARPAKAVPRQGDTPATVAVAGAADAAPAEDVLASAAPDFAAGPKQLDIDQLRRQAARNDTAFKTPLDKVREEELRRRSVETAVAAAAKAGARKDCQNGYSNMGIFAIIPLVYGTVTDSGCKWK